LAIGSRGSTFVDVNFHPSSLASRLAGSSSFWTASLAVALAEGAVGLWLRRLPLQSPDLPPLWLWSASLAALLAMRVGASWWRDLSQERDSLQAGSRFLHHLWTRASPPPDRAAWLSVQGREIAEQGERARHVLVSSSLSLAVLLPLMVWISPLLSASLLLLIPPLAWATRRRARLSRQWAGQEQDLLSNHGSDEQWAWRSHPETSASGFSPLLTRLRRQAARTLHDLRSTRVALVVRAQAQTEAAAHLAGWSLATLALAGWSRGLLSAPDLLAFLAASLLAYRPIREAGRALPAWHRYDHLRRDSAPVDRATATRGSGPLEVRKFLVRAPDGTILVQGPSFALRPGEILLLSGRNGSGKTSLLRGLSGALEASGVERFPKRVRVLAQEPVLPPFSPRQWSGAVRPDALPLLGILFPTGLPCAWDAPILDGGSRLSRGERARLALLCLTARPADLWLFDEPFSALPFAERPALLSALRGVLGQAALLFSDPLSLDPRDAPLVWEPGPGEVGPRILRL
jgi:ABC-type multidrug transport system fused ATPase/permease subunit